MSFIKWGFIPKSRRKFCEQNYLQQSPDAHSAPLSASGPRTAARPPPAARPDQARSTHACLSGPGPFHPAVWLTFSPWGPATPGGPGLPWRKERKGGLSVAVTGKRQRGRSCQAGRCFFPEGTGPLRPDFLQCADC